MFASKEIPFDPIGIQGSFSIPAIPTIERSSLSRFSPKDSLIRSPNGEPRARLGLTDAFDHGSYGTLYAALRDSHPVVVKRPRMPEMNLLQEGVLQHLAHLAAAADGVPWAVPKVLDVCTYGPEVWITMERVYGEMCTDWISTGRKGDVEMELLLAQVALLLAMLETRLQLDHRDLKLSNLVICPTPCTLRMTFQDTVWTLSCPFQVVLLDFGFACLGSEALRGVPWVNLGDGVLPPMDPCPKEGRDMFHLLVSLLGLPIFRERISQRLLDTIDRWLSSGPKSYGSMARRWSTHSWSYLVSSQPAFSIPSCCPFAILKDLLPELKGYLTRVDRV